MPVTKERARPARTTPPGPAQDAQATAREVRRTLSVGDSATMDEISAKLEEFHKKYPYMRVHGSTPRDEGDELQEARADLAACEAIEAFEGRFQPNSKK